MADETKEEIAMAECGACRAIVPLNSDNCPECDISFSGVSDESLGECGACQGLVPLNSTKCSHCGTIFVADDVVDVLRKWLAETGISIPVLFKKFDKDGDGQIDSGELKSGLLSLKLADLPPSQVDRLIDTIDEDGDGQIDLGELHETITGEVYSAVEKEESTPLETVEEVTTEDESEDE
ncbi:MAG: EF-hand domain-containing protein, partial [Candidatus Poseidoniaceae archaeon]